MWKVHVWNPCSSSHQATISQPMDSVAFVWDLSFARLSRLHHGGCLSPMGYQSGDSGLLSRVTVLWFHPELSFWIPRSLKQTRIQKLVLKKSSKTGKNRLENSSLYFLETLMYGWNLRTFRFFRMSSCSGQGEKLLKLLSFKRVRRNKNEKIVCLDGLYTKGLLLPLQKVLQNCSHKDLFKKKKVINRFILRFMIHKMFWVRMYLQCLAN